MLVSVADITLIYPHKTTRRLMWILDTSTTSGYYGLTN